LFLRSLGYVVPKIGLPGRPAGGIDVLGQIAGYSIRLSPKRVEEIIERSGFAHCLADAHYAPLDARLFAIRKSEGAQSVASLAIASLLSKKIAASVRTVGLDVRVGPHGNLGDTWSEAKINALRFCRVSALLGITAVCYLTENRFPPQPYVGRGEALLALFEWFSGRAEQWLSSHVDQCWSMAAALAGNEVAARPSAERAFGIFADNLRAQGASVDSFNHAVARIRDAYEPFEAASAGFVHLDINLIRDALVQVQLEASHDDNESFPDPAGIIFRSEPGWFVERGNVIALVRATPEARSTVTDAVKRSVSILPTIELGPGYQRVSIA
jgi:pyrimidine-nucleoside phosphorylase